MYGVADREEKIVFAVVGSISYRKAQDIFVQAVEELSPRERKKAEFWIVGSNIDMEIADIIKKKATQFSEIKIIPSMTRSTWEEESNNVDVLVCSSRHDPMPVVVTEFMRDKKACIVSDMTGQARYIADGVNGFIYQADDVSSLTEKMRWVINNYSELKAIGEEARKLYDEKFTMNVFEQNILRIIDEDISQ